MMRLWPPVYRVMGFGLNYGEKPCSVLLQAHLAEKTMHSTAKQAAKIAKLAEVKYLLLGHYSTRYGNIDLFKKEIYYLKKYTFMYLNYIDFS